MITYYRVNGFVPWTDVTINGQRIARVEDAGAGMGFSPVFDSLEEAQRHFPQASITPIHVEDEAVFSKDDLVDISFLK
jgi:hypothetical protein